MRGRKRRRGRGRRRGRKWRRRWRRKKKIGDSNSDSTTSYLGQKRPALSTVCDFLICKNGMKGLVSKSHQEVKMRYCI